MAKAEDKSQRANDKSRDTPNPLIVSECRRYCCQVADEQHGETDGNQGCEADICKEKR